MAATTTAKVPVRLVGRRRAVALPPGERRSMIIEATIPLVLEHGEMVTTRQIADAAGIAEGTVFRAFADKDELLSAVLDAALDTASLEQALDDIDASQPLIDVVTEAVEVAQRRQAEVWRILTGIGTRLLARAPKPLADSPALTRLLDAHSHELTVAPRVAARTLKALTLAMSHPLLAQRPASAREVAHRFLYGVATKGPVC